MVACLKGLLGNAQGLALIEQGRLLRNYLPVMVQLVVLGAPVVLHPYQSQQAENDRDGHGD